MVCPPKPLHTYVYIYVYKGVSCGRKGTNLKRFGAPVNARAATEAP